MSEQTLAPRRGALILGAMMLSTFLIVMVEALPNGLLTLLAPGLETSTARIGLLATGYALVVLFTTVPGTYLLRNVPRRWVLVGALAFAAIGMALGGLASGYSALLVSRLIAAIGQAQFWVAALPGTAGLFPPMQRGRVIALLALGNSFAPVAGLPAATWLAERVSWRASFFVISGLALVVMLLVLVLFPTVKPAAAGAAKAPHPSKRRLGFQLVAVVLLVTGSFGLFVFMTQILIDLGGYTQSDIPWLQVIQGSAGVLGAIVISRFIDRFAYRALLIACCVMLASLLILFNLGHNPFVAIAGLAVFSGAFATLPPVFTHRIMQVAIGSTAMAVAIQASLFNLGIAGASAIAAAVENTFGVRWVMLAGAGFVTLGLFVVILEHYQNPPLPLAGEVVN